MKISSDVVSLWETFSLQHDIRDQRKPLFESHLIYRHLTASHKFAGKTISVCSGVAILFGESCSRHLRHQLHDATRDCIVAGWCENRFLQNKKVILSLVIHFRYFGLPKLLLFISSKAKAFRSGTMLYPSPWCYDPVQLFVKWQSSIGSSSLRCWSSSTALLPRNLFWSTDEPAKRSAAVPRPNGGISISFPWKWQRFQSTWKQAYIKTNVMCFPFLLSNLVNKNLCAI